jgi:Amt family ammonium transporter
MNAMMSLSICTMQWLFFGYSFAFGPGNKGFGSFRYGAYKYVEKDPSGVYGTNVPHVAFAFFQNQFSAITPALIFGSIVGRMKFWPSMLFIFLWTTCIYDTLAHWVWSITIDPVTWAATPLGWLGQLGTIDFAGGTVIHISSGFGGLAACLALGKRKKHEEVKPHNQSLVLIGTSFLWFGWIGFNAGSEGAADGVAAIAAMNTHVAASAGFISWVVIETIFEKKATLVGGCTGAVAALVAITPGSGYVWPWAATFFGIFPCIFGYLFIRIKQKLRYDDTLDAFAIHGIGGVVGAFLTGLFATKDVNPNIMGGAFYGYPKLLGYQMAAIVVSASFSFVGTLVLVYIMKYTIGIKVSEEEENIGLDRLYHGGPSYDLTRTPSHAKVGVAVQDHGHDQGAIISNVTVPAQRHVQIGSTQNADEAKELVEDVPQRPRP